MILPVLKCVCCHAYAPVLPSAVAFGCFPMTPSQPQVWFDIKVHQAYQRLGLMEGLSATAYLTMLSKGHEYWGGTWKNILANQYESSFCAFLGMYTGIDSLPSLGVEVMDDGPFSDCGVCAYGPAGI